MRAEIISTLIFSFRYFLGGELMQQKTMWRKALIATAILVFVGFGAIIINLVRWQIIRGEELRSVALEQSLWSTELTATRGTIYDATGKVLAQSANVWTVVLEPFYLHKDETRSTVAKGLAEILGMSEEEVFETASNKDSYFAYLKKRVETSVRDEINAFMEENEIDRGIRMIEDFKRYYPYGSVASTILGFTGEENTGLYGLEAEYDNELRGTAGRLINSKNAIGDDMPFQYEQFIDAQDGYNLILTIDETVQSVTEKALETGIERYAVESGAVGIVIDVKTGGIVAMACKDDFDPNSPFEIHDEEERARIDALPEAEQNEAYTAALQNQWRNKAISDVYYPGSVFKMITGSMGLEEGIVNEDTPFNCTGAYVYYEDEDPIHCWLRTGHGTQTFTQGLLNSCNPYFMYIGQQLGAARFYKYFEGFGFAERTGIDLPDESASLYYDADSLGPADIATGSMGQNFGITPIQMITGICAVANGGYLVQPHVVNRIVDSDGNIVKTTDTAYKRQVISEETSKRISNILRMNTEIGVGTATKGYVAGYRICGKTGTSEKVEKYNNEVAEGVEKPTMQYIASYGGYAPADDPQYALLVFFDEPQKEENGGLNGGDAVAGPIFADIMAEILPYLGVKSQYSEEEYENLDATTPSVMGMMMKDAKTVLEEAGLSYEIVGVDDNENEVVAFQVPAVGEYIPKNGTVVLYTQGAENDAQGIVPDVRGQSIESARYMLEEAGFQLRLQHGRTSDSAIANQDIEPGTLERRGTVITVSFADNTITETFQFSDNEESDDDYDSGDDSG